MFGVGYHVLSHVTGQPIWSGSMTKASMLLLFVTIPPFFLAESTHAQLRSINRCNSSDSWIDAIMAASANMLATIRGNASAVVDSPVQLQQLEQQFYFQSMHFGYFTGLNVMVGDGSLAGVADTVNSSFLYVIGGLFALSALFHHTH